MNLKLLKTLTEIHSVAGDEINMENFIINFALENGLQYTYKKGYGVIIGNPKASFYCISHIDEVGGRISEINGNELKFKGLGRVSPSMFINRDVEIRTRENEIIPGVVVGNQPLKNEYKRYFDIKMIIDKSDVEKVRKGDYFRFKSNYIERSDCIMATSLDDRIGVFILLEFISKHKEEKELFDNVAFYFETEEEIENKGGRYFLRKYLPEDIFIFDIIPENRLKGIFSTNTFILRKSLDFTLNKEYEKLFSTINNVTFIDTKCKRFKTSESQIYSGLTGGNTVNIICPIYGFHSGTYVLEKETIRNLLSFSESAINGLLKNKKIG